MQKKYCPECGLFLEIVKFKKLTTKKALYKNPDGYYWCCDDCYRKKEWVYNKGEEPYQNRKFRRREKRAKRITAVEYKYKLSEEDYIKMIAEQQNVCLICGIKDLTKILCVDHDHITGKVRGLLCNNCNIGLGNFKDNPKILESAIAYLLKKG